MLKKYKTEVIIFLVGFLLYFTVGIFLSYYLGTAKYWNVLFDLDTPRVLGDLSIRDFNHYRTAVHPLFVLFFQPIVYFLKVIFKDPVIAILLIQSTMASLFLVIFHILLNKMKVDNKSKIVFTLVFAFNFGQIVYAAAVETYIYAQFFLILLWCFVYYKLDKKLSFLDFIFLALLGIGSLAVTITNFMQFLIALIVLIIFNKKINKKILVVFTLVTCVISVSVLLAEVQNVFWPSAPNFFSKGIQDLISGNSEEKLYIAKEVGIKNIVNVLNTNFSNSFNISNLHNPSKGYLAFKDTMFSSGMSILMGISFLILNIIFIIKSKFKFSKHKFYYALLLAYLFNFVLHMFYGNSIAFIYICHFNFLFFLIIIYCLNYLKINLFKYRYFIQILVLVLLILSFKNIITMFKLLMPIYNPISYFRILPIFIIFVTCSLLIIFILKNKYLKGVSIIILFILLYFTHNFINKETDPCEFNCREFRTYFESLDNYKKQLIDMKNEFNVDVYSERKSPVDIYFFGMANRPKILYKEGKLIDIKTKKIIKEINYKHQLIVPNEYSVLLTDTEGNNYIIFETIDGIYISKNGELESLYKSDQSINLPEFEKNKYSEILKVTHQEILFNIDGDIPKPNLITYSGAWYRDTMLAVKVLEETKNVALLQNWVKSIDSIYDYQRDLSIKEADNLGELLYIIGAVGVKRNDLVKQIKEEIGNLKRSDGAISGMVDGVIQSYYPTVLAIYGAKKVGIELDLTVPKIDDGYAKLTWYYDVKRRFNTTINSLFYPYIGWAFYHFDNYSGKLYVLDEIYPLSYEGGYGSGGTERVEAECFISEYYCEEKLFLSHSWHASEMFLYLKKY